MFLTVNTGLLTMLTTSLACDADALGSIKVEEEIMSVSSASLNIHVNLVPVPPLVHEISRIQESITLTQTRFPP